MKKIIYSIMLFIFLSSPGSKLIAQDRLMDDTEERFQQQAKKDPSLLQKRKELEKWTSEYIAHHPMTARSSSLVPNIIPVVVHVLHTGGSENISKAQILDQIRITNEDLRRLNPDTVNTPVPFRAVAADCNIELRLAHLDPNGNCTEGIDRIFTPLTNNADFNSFINQWPQDKYLNIWVVNSIGNATTAGFTNYPGGTPAYDGIILINDYFGSIGTAAGNPWNGRTLTHLFGLYMNVFHIWGDDAGLCTGDDYVSDTPNQANNSTGCPSFPVYDSCTSTGNGIMFMNFMDFTNGSCQNLFTIGQAARMSATLASSASWRDSLITPSNLAATGTDGTPPVVCVPIADFFVNTHRICRGDSVYFSNSSYNTDTIISFSWNFPGGIPSTSNLANTFVAYPTPGVYNVTLTVTGSAGIDSVTFASCITVADAFLTPNYLDDFETAGTFPGLGGYVENHDNSILYRWNRITGVVGSSGNSCIEMTNDGFNIPGEVDSWITPSFDLTFFSSCQLRFKLAYARFNVSSTDQLKVFFSANCGASWSQRYIKSGAALATTSGLVSNFIPDSLSQWRQETANLSGANGKANVCFKFEFTAGPDNNLFIDDLELTGINVGTDELNRENLNFIVYPSPTNETAAVSFNLMKQSKTEVLLFDITGRQVKKIASGNLETGAHSYFVNTGEMSNGIYFVKIKTGEITDVQKLIVE